MFKYIKNLRDLQKEKGLYYPYIMQMMGAPVVNGALICDTSLKHFYDYLIPCIAETLKNMYNIRTGERLFNELNKGEFKDSMIYAISDLFCGGCEPEDMDEEQLFAFLDDF